MSKTITTTALCAALFSVATTAQAKDPYEITADLVGNKVLYAKVIDSNATKAGRFKTTMEFMHHGGDEVVVVDSAGARSVSGGAWGAGTVSWEDDNGLTYTVKDYPTNNQGEPVAGEIFSGDQWVGKFRLEAVKVKRPVVAGRWTGELAFPGGKSAGLSMQVASVGQRVGSDCVSYNARVSLTGLGYEPASLTRCGEETTFGAGFFYFDDRSADRYFVSVTVEATPDGEILQGGVFMLPLNGGNGAEGKIFVQRPAVLNF